MSPEHAENARARLLADNEAALQSAGGPPENADDGEPRGDTSLVLYESLGDGDEVAGLDEDFDSLRGSYRWPLLLLLLPVSGAFAGGFQSVCVITLLNLALWLTLLELCRDRYDFLLIIALQSTGRFVAFMGLLGSDAGSVAATLVAMVAEVVLLTVLIATPMKQLPRRFTFFKSRIHWTVPVCFTAYYAVAAMLVSSLTNPAYAFADFDSLFQLVSLLGLDVVNFIVAAAVALSVATAFKHEDEPAPRGLRPFGIVVMLLFTFAGARRINLYGSFFQSNVVTWTQGDAKSINALCVVGYHANEEGTIDARLETTRKLAESHLFLSSNFDPEGADLIMWSEEATSVPSKAEETRFLQELGKIAVDNQVMIGATYELILSGRESTHSKPKANVFALILSNGTVSFRYQKVHAVFMLESFDTEPGSSPVKAIKTGGRTEALGGAIGFDFDFPEFIRSAAVNAELMLLPARDWNTIGRLHARMASTRAIENGFTLFRCTSGGISGVYSPYGKSVHEKVTGTAEGQTAVFATQIPKSGRAFTLYSFVGNGFGLFCVGATVLSLLLSIMPHSCIYMAIFSFLSPVYPEKL